jgi:hypothetical protein
MTWALRAVAGTRPISVRHITEIHRRLLSDPAHEPCRPVRTQQNWIGGSSCPCSSSVRAASTGDVEPLLEDLPSSPGTDTLPPIVRRRSPMPNSRQSIHLPTQRLPTGRVLVHLILGARASPCASCACLAHPCHWSSDYVQALTGTRIAEQ